MARRELGREIGDGVVFYGYEEEGGSLRRHGHSGPM
jgi:hypothetical protein